jgi:hypothetical protein
MKTPNSISVRTLTIGLLILSLLSVSASNHKVLAKPPGHGGGGGGGGGSNITFSGEGKGLDAFIKVPLLGINIDTVLSDTGPLPSSGGSLEASLLQTDLLGVLSADVLHAATIGQGDRSRSEASLADIDLTLTGLLGVSADFLMARATAQCTKQGPSVRGSSEVASLIINGQPILVSTQPNQTIPLLNGAVVINEQTSNGPGDITVNALHVYLNNLVDVVSSSAHADITCSGGKPACQGGDFVTGGGWITGTPSEDRGNFGVGGGIKNGSFWGHLTYIDHGNGMKVKGTGVTGYEVASATTRYIDGTAEINGQGGFTYEVDVTDNGEPGRNDVFTIRLSNGYSASGLLDGGNIQLHKPCQ